MNTRLLANQEVCRVPWGHHEEVPQWALDEEATRLPAELFREGYRNEIYLLNGYAGPALLIARRAFCETGLLFLATPAIACVLSEPASMTVAHSPFWLLPVLCFGIFRLLWLEHKARSFILVPMCHYWVDTSPTVMGIQFASFVPWLLSVTCMSMLSHLDIITSGIFFGRWMKTWLWESADNLSAIWSLTMQHSIIGNGLSSVPFAAWAALAWVFVAIQGIYAFRHSWPLTGKGLTGRTLHYELGYSFNRPLEDYATRADNVSRHALALLPLLEVTRMASLSDYYKQAIQMEVLTIVRYQAPDILGQRLRKALTKLVLFSLLQGGYTLNLESAGLGLARASNNKIDTMTLASLAIGLAIGCSTVVKELQLATDMKNTILSIDIIKAFRETMAFANQDRAETDAFIEAFETGQPPQIPLNEFWIKTRSARLKSAFAYQRKARPIYGSLVFVAILYFFAAARATHQAFMILCVCESGLYDMGVGCIALPHSLASSK